MTQKFLPDGRVVPVTAVEAGPCTIVQVKGEADGYQAVQVGFGQRKKINKPLAGHLKGLPNFRYLREFRVDNASGLERGKVFDVSSFKVGDILQVSATSKGKGFQGVVKRHHFRGAPKTHGHKDQLRMPGSIGSTDPARVFKGTRMAGRMGGDAVTVKNLELIEIDTDKNLLYIKGAVPGARNAFVRILASGDLVLMDKAAEPKMEQPKDVESEAVPVETSVEPVVEAPAETKPEAEDKTEVETPIQKEEKQS